MKETKQTETKPPKYDEAFRQQAVRMWKQSGKAAELTARELGISVFQRSGGLPRPIARRRCRPRTSGCAKSWQG
jgi:hypothetical protein